MNRNAIFSAHNITLSDRKNAPLYSASQMLHLYLHAKQENSPLFLPDCCSEKELNAFAQFIEENKEAFTNTKKGLPCEIHRGASLFSDDEKQLYLFIFTDANTPILLKGMLKSKKEITYLKSGKAVSVDEIEEPWNGANTIWLQLEASEIRPLCTVVRIKSDTPLKLFFGTGVHIKT